MTDNKARIIFPNGSKLYVLPNNSDDTFTVREVKGVVRGWYEIISLSNNNVAVIKGKARAYEPGMYPYNKEASELIGCDVSGTVLFCKSWQVQEDNELVLKNG